MLSKLYARLGVKVSSNDLTWVIRYLSNKWLRKKGNEKEKEEMAKVDREENWSGKELPFTLLISSYNEATAEMLSG